MRASSPGPHPSRISVVVPTLNEEAYITGLLRSIRAQRPRPLEVIVVDGGSQDRTVELARRLGAKVIEQPSNIAEARNIGARAARGDYLLFLDADTVLPPGFMEAIGRLGPVDCAIFRPEPLEMSFLGRLGCVLGWLLCRLKIFNPCYMGVLVRKDIFWSVGGFRTDLAYNEDLDLLRRLVRRARIVHPKHIYLYNSTRRWTKDGRLRLGEVLHNIFRLLEYFLTKRSGERYRLYH